MKRKPVYVLYDGDEVVAIGTAEEIAKQRGIKPQTVVWYASAECHRKGRNIQAERVFV